MNLKYKYYYLAVIFLLSLFIPVFAANVEVQSAMSSKSNEQDRVWVGTFQLAWNEFMDRYTHGPVLLKEGTPVFVHELNKKTFSSANLEKDCYYTYSGKITPNTSKNIEKAIKEKFNETSRLLESLNLLPGINKYLIYVMFKKNFEFIKEFDNLGKAPFGKNMTAEYFGINNHSEKTLSEGVKILYYNNDSDFAVKLLTKSNDEVYLYRNNSNKDFTALYRDMNIKTWAYHGDKILGKEDELKVPIIKFSVDKTFNELSSKHVVGTNIVIEKAMETVDFNMDNKGVKLKSEAGILMQECILKPQRHFYFNSDFIIFLKEKNKKIPYFALRIHDITKFQ